jgi:hypothetical protein
MVFGPRATDPAKERAPALTTAGEAGRV